MLETQDQSCTYWKQESGQRGAVLIFFRYCLNLISKREFLIWIIRILDIKKSLISISKFFYVKIKAIFLNQPLFSISRYNFLSSVIQIFRKLVIFQVINFSKNCLRYLRDLRNFIIRRIRPFLRNPFNPIFVGKKIFFRE